MTTAVKRVAGMSCTTQKEKKEVLQADLEQRAESKCGPTTLLQTEVAGAGKLGPETLWICCKKF